MRANRRLRLLLRRWPSLWLPVLSVVAAGACSSDAAPSNPDNGGTAAETQVTVAPQASTVVDVRFDFPGDTPRPLRETTVLIYRPTEKLVMRITDITYRGVVCGFSLRGDRPTAPVAIRLFGEKQSGTFDSGPVPVSWEGDVVKAGAAEDGGWSFSAEAHANRNGPGWVISIGGVTAAAEDAIPKSAGCELTSPTRAFLPGAGPIGYWAGYATV